MVLGFVLMAELSICDRDWNSLQSLKYLLSDLLQKKLANPWSKSL